MKKVIQTNRTNFVVRHRSCASVDHRLLIVTVLIQCLHFQLEHCYSTALIVSAEKIVVEIWSVETGGIEGLRRMEWGNDGYSDQKSRDTIAQPLVSHEASIHGPSIVGFVVFLGNEGLRRGRESIQKGIFGSPCLERVRAFDDEKSLHHCKCRSAPAPNTSILHVLSNTCPHIGICRGLLDSTVYYNQLRVTYEKWEEESEGVS